ncbi:hypothetical protein D3C72_783610 [compost metagenome]
MIQRIGYRCQLVQLVIRIFRRIAIRVRIGKDIARIVIAVVLFNYIRGPVRPVRKALTGDFSAPVIADGLHDIPLHAVLRVASESRDIYTGHKVGRVLVVNKIVVAPVQITIRIKHFIGSAPCIIRCLGYIAAGIRHILRPSHNIVVVLGTN